MRISFEKELLRNIYAWADVSNRTWNANTSLVSCQRILETNILKLYEVCYYAIRMLLFANDGMLNRATWDGKYPLIQTVYQNLSLDQKAVIS